MGVVQTPHAEQRKQYNALLQACTDSGRQVSYTTKFSTSSRLASRILKWLRDFWKRCNIALPSHYNAPCFGVPPFLKISFTVCSHVNGAFRSEVAPRFLENVQHWYTITLQHTIFRCPTIPENLFYCLQSCECCFSILLFGS
jgi:hypothetical protein